MVKHFIKTFVNDEDGMSAKDYLVLVFTTLYALFLITAFVLALMGHLPPQVMQIISSMDGVVITIVGGVFAIQGVQYATNGFGRGPYGYGSYPGGQYPMSPYTPMSNIVPSVIPVTPTTPGTPVEDNSGVEHLA